MLFKLFAHNRDDHTKNIAFLMDAGGKWRLSSAFDVTCSYNPAGQWTSQHQMSVNGKRDHFTLGDLVAVGQTISISCSRIIIEEVRAAVERWSEFAAQAGLESKRMAEIARHHRLKIQ